MIGIWGKGACHPYSDKSLKLFESLVDKVRSDFLKEFDSALKDRHKNELYIGSRFRSNDQILWVLRSKITEEIFVADPEHYLMRVFLGAADADYYYNFEKQW